MQAWCRAAKQEFPGPSVTPSATAAPAAGAVSNGNTLTFTLLSVLNVIVDREQLPVPIDSALMAFNVPLGCPSNSVNPNIDVCANIGASATCKNSKFWQFIRAVRLITVLHIYFNDKIQKVMILLLLFQLLPCTLYHPVPKYMFSFENG